MRARARKLCLFFPLVAGVLTFLGAFPHGRLSIHVFNTLVSYIRLIPVPYPGYMLTI